MKYFLSILISLSVITGSVGINQLNHKCSGCVEQAAASCCGFKLVKLEVPVVLVSQIEEITVPQSDIKGDLFFSPPTSFLNIFLQLEKIPDKPPSLSRSCLNLHCVFLC